MFDIISLSPDKHKGSPLSDKNFRKFNYQQNSCVFADIDFVVIFIKSIACFF